MFAILSFLPGDSAFRTLIVVRELAGGEVVAYPAAEPQWASFGEEEEVLLEQRVFLTSYLSRVPPDVVARHALPARTRLHVSSVVVPRDDLPRRIALEEPLDIPCLVLPAKHPEENARPESWVCVLPLAHTFHLAAAESRALDERDERERLDEAIEHEVKRMVSAEERTPLQWLDLVPDGESRLVTLDLFLDRGETGPAGRAASLAKALAEREKKRAALAVLESIGTPLHLADGSHPRPLVGRDDELELLRSLLGGETRGSVLIVGGDRVGKTALFQAWVHRERAAEKARPIFATSGAQLIAGMSGLGQWQERVRRVMQAAAELDAVLYFDDLGDLFADRPTGNVDLAGAMKPWLDDAKVRVVGELRESRVDLAESRHVGFFSLLARLRVPPMKTREAEAVLRALIAHDGQHAPHKPQLDPIAAVPMIDLAERYLPYEQFPGKAVRLYDELRGAHEMSSARRGDPDEAAPKLGLTELYEGFSLRSGVPVFLLREDRVLLQVEVEAQLRARVVGQEDAVRRVAETVCMVKAGLQPPGKPLSTFLFVGPTGIGKTELARALAELLFGSEARLVRFDMSEFMDPLAADRLIRGNERGEGLLTRRVREQPFCVILLDEIEKAHAAVFDLLLQVAGEGRLTDARGRTAHFQNAILILTSNLGATHGRSEMGFAREGKASDETQYLRVVHETFRPEMVNRLDRIVVFRSLQRSELARITTLSIAKICTRRGLAAASGDLEVSEAASTRLADDGFSAAYGARSLRRHLEVHLVDRMASLISGFGGIDGHRVAVTAEGEPEPIGQVASELEDGVRISMIRAEKRAITRASRGMGAISSIRREMQRLLRLPPIEQLRDQVEYLITELNYGSGNKRAKKLSGAALSLSQAEHHRLSTIHAALDLGFRDVCTLEELALAGYFEGHPLDELSDEAHRTRGSFRTAMARALVAQETRRDSIALLLQELDDGRAFNFYLAPLLADAARRRFITTVHFEAEGGTGPYGRFAAAMSGEDALVHLQTSKARCAVVFVQGEMCAPFLALEGGIHRFDGLHAEYPEVILSVQRLAFRPSLSTAEWRGKKVVPALPNVVAELRRVTPTRHFDAREGRLTLLKKVRMAMTHEEYFPRLEEIALEHLLLFEKDEDLEREDSFTVVLDGLDDIYEIAKTNKIMAIKEYRERFGVGLKEAKDAVELLVKRRTDEGA